MTVVTRFSRSATFNVGLNKKKSFHCQLLYASITLCCSSVTTQHAHLYRTASNRTTLLICQQYQPCIAYLIIPTANLTYNKSTFSPHSVFMCFVWISEPTAIISLYSINWLVFITESGCVYCAVRTGYLYITLRSAHTVYLCVLFGSRNQQRLFHHTALTDRFL
jgi:hypothetical protein